MKKLPQRNLPWPISWEGVVEIAESEGCKLTAYQDIVGVWTIGWGETEGVTEGMVWSQAKADQRLCARLEEFSGSVRHACKVPPNDNELAAMTSLAYNIGIGGFRRSSVLKNHNAGDKISASRAFGLWNKAGGKVVNGLVLRRAREAALYLKPAYTDEAPTLAQKVDPESKLTSSPIAQSGVTTAATGGVALLASVSSDLKELAQNLSVDPLLVFGVIGLVVGGVVTYQRYKQRKEGWA